MGGWPAPLLICAWHHALRTAPGRLLPAVVSLRLPVPAATHAFADSDEAAKFWAGTLRPGPNPRPEEYPVDCCSWGVYVRYHGASGQASDRPATGRLVPWRWCSPC